MKKLMLAVGLMLGGFAFVNAQDKDTTSTQQQTTEQNDQYRKDQSTNQDQSTNKDESAAQDQSTTTQDQSVNYQDQDKEGQKIETSELPAAVQSKLQSTDYQGWVVTSARKKMWSDPNNAQSESKEIYIVEVKNGADTKNLKFDKDGNKIEDMKDKDDQK